MYQPRLRAVFVFLAVALGLLSATAARAHIVKPLCEQTIKPEPAESRVIDLICEAPPEHPDYKYGDTDLAKADIILNGYYRAARDAATDKAAVQREQLLWLKTRNLCTDRACLNERYHSRILELTFRLGSSAMHKIASVTGGGASGRFILTRANGLALFDNNQFDYDLMGTADVPQWDRVKQCKKAKLHLIGTGKIIAERCNPDNRGVYKPTETTDGIAFQMIIGYDNWLLEGVLHDGSRVLSEPSALPIWPEALQKQYPLWEPFGRKQTRYGVDGKTVWRYYLVWRTRPEENVPEKYRCLERAVGMYLADRSIITPTGFRFDPLSGEFYDHEHIRRIAVDDAETWKAAWIKDYLSETPACGGELLRCPDRKQLQRYLRQRFDQEMDRQFARPYR